MSAIAILAILATLVVLSIGDRDPAVARQSPSLTVAGSDDLPWLDEVAFAVSSNGNPEAAVDLHIAERAAHLEASAPGIEVLMGIPPAEQGRPGSTSQLHRTSSSMPGSMAA